MNASVILAEAADDLKKGMKLKRLWTSLAFEEIANQHRRSWLGPLWLTINYLFFVWTFVFIIHRGAENTNDYTVFVATGLLVWFLIMESVLNGVNLFVQNEGFIKGTTLPITVYVLKQSIQILIRIGYASAGWVVIMALSDVTLTVNSAYAILGLIIILLAVPPTVTVFAFIGAIIPDSVYLIGHMMRIGMFLTPIFWSNADSGARKIFYYANPFTYFVDVVRSPIVFSEFSLHSALVCVGVSILAWLVAIVMIGGYKKKLVFLL